MFDAIPFFIGFYILNTEIGAQIHNFHFGEYFLIHKGGTQALWGCGKNHVNQIRQLFHIIIHTFIIHDTEHVPVNFVILLINITSGTIPGDFHLRVCG